MDAQVTADRPLAVAADLLAVPVAGGEPSPAVRELDALLGGRLLRAARDASPVALVDVGGELAAERVAAVAVDGEDADAVRTAAAAVVRGAPRGVRSVAWVLDETSALPPAEQVRALVEGAVLAGYELGRWKSEPPPARPARFAICADAALAAVAARAATVARWVNAARELVDAPPNEVTPAGLAQAAVALAGSAGALAVDVLDERAIDERGLAALATVGRGSGEPPRLVVLRHAPADAVDTLRLGLVGKAITFDSGGYFLKPQADIVRQKADMAGGAAVVAAACAIAELALPLAVTAVVPAAENALAAGAFRPGDVLRTASGTTVEVTNPDAEGRLVLADALWYALRDGATRLVDLATLTGAMRSGMGDVYGGVFSNDDEWRARVVEAGNGSGDHAWPWPLHRRYRRGLESQLADLRNTSGKSFGFPIFAAAFIERFVEGRPWAHLDIHGAAFLDEQRDYLTPGATGYGVRLLVELATRLSAGG